MRGIITVEDTQELEWLLQTAEAMNIGGNRASPEQNHRQHRSKSINLRLLPRGIEMKMVELTL